MRRQRDIPTSPHVRPLAQAERHFLQVLVRDFTLSRCCDASRGARLELEIPPTVDAIWSNHGKEHLRRHLRGLDRRNVQRVQQELRDVLLSGRVGRSRFDEARTGLRFRYGSGGVLPIVYLGGKHYYCFFYREIHPIGWNLANGGCDSRAELLAPLTTAERELREELLIFDFTNRRRYVFRAGDDDVVESPDFALVRKLISERHRHVQLDAMEPWPLPLKWIDGPDQIVVRMGEFESTIDGCFLNINAEDFGIEVDRVAWLSIDEDAILMDGEPTETADRHLVNAPIGLFEVERFGRRLEEAATREREFVPDVIYWDLQKIDLRGRGEAAKRKTLEGVVGRFFAGVERTLSAEARTHFVRFGKKYRLCPVTRTIVERYRHSADQAERPRAVARQLRTTTPKVFVSYASEDVAYAERVADMLRSRRQTPFFSPLSIRNGDFSKIIDQAIDKCEHMVVVGSRLQHLEKRWVEYEWRRFHVLTQSGRKRQGKLIPYLERGVQQALLPGPLVLQHALRFDKDRPSRMPSVRF